jgi:hypothetical protein
MNISRGPDGLEEGEGVEAESGANLNDRVTGLDTHLREVLGGVTVTLEALGGEQLLGFVCWELAVMVASVWAVVFAMVVVGHVGNEGKMRQAPSQDGDVRT